MINLPVEIKDSIAEVTFRALSLKMIKNLLGEGAGSEKRHSFQARGTAWTKALLIYIELVVNPNNSKRFYQAIVKSRLPLSLLLI